MPLAHGRPAPDTRKARRRCATLLLLLPAGGGSDEPPAAASCGGRSQSGRGSSVSGSARRTGACRGATVGSARRSDAAAAVGWVGRGLGDEGEVRGGGVPAAAAAAARNATPALATSPSSSCRRHSTHQPAPSARACSLRYMPICPTSHRAGSAQSRKPGRRAGAAAAAAAAAVSVASSAAVAPLAAWASMGAKQTLPSCRVEPPPPPPPPPPVEAAPPEPAPSACASLKAGLGPPGGSSASAHGCRASIC